MWSRNQDSRGKKIKRLESALASMEEKFVETKVEAIHFHEDRDRLALELAEIRGSLSQVAVYEGLVDSSPLAMMVSELVRDHEELEARIDAAIHRLFVSLRPSDLSESGEAVSSAAFAAHYEEAIHEAARLLQGGQRVPDDPGDLSI